MPARPSAANPPSGGAASDGLVAAAADAARAWLLPLLVAVYALGALAPGPGGRLAAWRAGDSPYAPRFSGLMVAAMLFSGAAAASPTARLAGVAARPLTLAAGLAAVWLPSMALALAWAVAARALAPPSDASGLAVGLLLVAAMPVANSAVAWTQQTRGDLAWALGLVLLSIAVCPWLTTPLVAAIEHAFPGPSNAASGKEQVARFSGLAFGLWVLGPTLLGLSTRAAIPAGTLARLRPALAMVSAAALLALNYANAAAAAPRLLASSSIQTVALALLAAASLPAATHALGWRLAGAIGLPRGAQSAWAYAIGMKNTGLALALADSALGRRPVAVLVVLLSTLLQHAAASIAHRLASRGLRPRP